MSKVTFRIGRKGVSKGVFVAELFDVSELDTTDTLEDFIKKENNAALVSTLKERLSEDIDYSECTAMHGADGAYIELIDDTTNTTILLKLASTDHDGNDLYLESCYDEETDRCNIDMNNTDVLEEIFEIVADSEDPDIDITGNTVSFNESEQLWLDTTLAKAIETLGIENNYSEEALNKIKNDSSSIYDDEEINRIDNEVLEIEREELKFSNIISKNTGKIVAITIDGCGGVSNIEQIDTIDTDRLSYDLMISIGSLVDDSDFDDSSDIEDMGDFEGLFDTLDSDGDIDFGD
jgi:hypothetical protein